MADSLVMIVVWIQTGSIGSNLGGSVANTDADGRFSISGILPEKEYQFRYLEMVNGEPENNYLIAKVKLEPGNETHDLGELRFKKPEPHRRGR